MSMQLDDSVSGRNAGMKRGKLSKRAMKTFNYTDMSLQNTPSVVLASVDGSFQTRTLELFEPVEVGRKVGNATKPASTNAVFDSRVLSRKHAQIYAEKGSVFVRDSGSSNGTFVNGNRLSEEGEKSEPVELKDGDVVDFGMDVTDDSGNVEFSRIACKVTIVSGENLLGQCSGAEKPQRDTVDGPSKAGKYGSIKPGKNNGTIHLGAGEFKNLKSLATELSALEDEQNALAAAIEGKESKEQNTQSSGDVDRLQEENSNLQILLDSKTKEIKDQREEISQLTRKNKELDEKAAKSEKELAALRSQFSQDRKNHVAAASSVKENKDKISQLNNLVSELQTQLAEANNREKSVTTELQRIEKELQKVQDQQKQSSEEVPIPASGKSSIRRRNKKGGNKNGELSRAGSEITLESKAAEPTASSSRWRTLTVFTVVAFGIISITGFAYIAKQR